MDFSPLIGAAAPAIIEKEHTRARERKKERENEREKAGERERQSRRERERGKYERVRAPGKIRKRSVCTVETESRGGTRLQKSPPYVLDVIVFAPPERDLLSTTVFIETPAALPVEPQELDNSRNIVT